MEIRRGHLVAVAGVGAAVAAYLIGDALIVSDEEKVGELVEAITGEMTAERIDAAFAWVDPATAPVEVVVFGDTRLYEDRAELRERAGDAIRVLRGQRLRALRENVEIEDGVAALSLQLLSDQGLANVDFRLEERGDRWLITRVRVR